MTCLFLAIAKHRDQNNFNSLRVIISPTLIKLHFFVKHSSRTDNPKFQMVGIRKKKTKNFKKTELNIFQNYFADSEFSIFSDFTCQLL